MTNGLQQKWRDYYLNECNINGENAPLITDRKLHALSLFSGIGGIDIACELNNIETVAFCEIDEYGQEILKLRWENAYIVGKDKKIDGGIPIFSDVKKLSARKNERGEVTLYYDGTAETRPQKIQAVQGGFPCQDYSSMGARQGNAGVRALFGQLCRLVYEIRPRWVIGENVVGFKSLGLDGLLSKLGALQYSTRTFCYPALSQNAPIPRYRVFVVGFDSNFRREGSSTDDNKDGETVQGNLGEFAGGDSGESEGEGMEGNNEGTYIIRTNAGRDGWRNARTQREVWSELNKGSYNSRKIFKPGLDRVADGDGRKVSTQGKHRVKALGNAVNPIQLYPLVRYLKYIDDLVFDGDNRIILHDETVSRAEEIVKQIRADGRLQTIRESFWAKKTGDDIANLFEAKKDYRPYDVCIKVKCTPKLCKEYGKTVEINGKKQLPCDPEDGTPLWVRTNFHNLWQSNLEFAKILFPLSESAGYEKQLFNYLQNAAVVEEVWKQLVESDLLCKDDDGNDIDIESRMEAINNGLASINGMYCQCTIGLH